MRRQSGFTLIELMVVVAIIATLAAIAIPNLLEARKAGNQTAALAELKSLSPGGFTTGTHERSGYRFTRVYVDGYDYRVNADPIAPGRSGDKYFFVDATGFLRFSTTGPADANSAGVD